MSQDFQVILGEGKCLMNLPSLSLSTWMVRSITPTHRRLRPAALALAILWFGNATVVAQSCISPASGLIGWWPAEGSAIDATDRNAGSLLNGANFSVGRVGQAFDLDGVNDHIRVADQSNLRLTTGLTVEVWIYPASIGTPRSIVSKWNGVIGPTLRSFVLGLQSDDHA